MEAFALAPFTLRLAGRRLRQGASPDIAAPEPPSRQRVRIVWSRNRPSLR